MKLFLILFLFLSVTITGFSSDVATGYVYHDRNNNQIKDASEKGIADVPVSNGRDVVLTGEDGKYVLPVGNDDIIFVIKPTGYTTPLSEQNLPLFYYIHKPLGSPPLKYKGVAPTGDLPELVNFPLYIENEGDKFNVLLFGDPQSYNKNELNYFEQRIVSELYNQSDVSFGITVGDLIGDNLDLFEPHNEVISKIGIPWYNVIGNHDMNFDIEADSLSNESFERVFGPSTYSFNVGKAHFVILKDILRPDPRDQRGYWGGLTQKQLTFLKNDLKFVPKDHLVVLAFHIPIWEGYVDRDIFRDEDREKLFSLLEDFPHTLSISAHSHIQINKFLTREDGWMQDKPHHHINLGTTCGSWHRGELNNQGIPISVMADGTPQGYAFLQIDKNQYEIKYKAAGYDEAHQMNIYHPKVIKPARRSLANVFVNFFMGSANDEVMFRVDKGDWIPMNYSIEFDPSYLHLIHKWDFTEQVIPGRRPKEARKCHHLWKAPLPADLELGTHFIEIRAKDMYGNVHYGESSYKVDRP